ncbi:hypothetical protein N9W41_01535 [bacterium]|nr:hypothetical protein [bacterium]
MLLKSEITKNFFEGSLNEIQPVLIKKAFESKKVVLALSDNKKYFKYVFYDENSKHCREKSNNLAFKIVYTAFKGRVHTQYLCMNEKGI